MAEPAGVKPMASRQWSCSELQEGMAHVTKEAQNPAELSELQAG